MIAYRCRILVTMDGTPIDNGVFVVDGPNLLQIGEAREILRHHAGPVVDLGEVAVMPGLINAHCHLDYSLMRGAILSVRSFAQWVSRINSLKRSLTDDDYLHATQLGFEELRRNGVTTVLDIVATPQTLPLLPPPPIRTWSFLELISGHGYSFPKIETGSAVSDLARTLHTLHLRKCMKSRLNVPECSTCRSQPMLLNRTKNMKCSPRAAVNFMIF